MSGKGAVPRSMDAAALFIWKEPPLFSVFAAVFAMIGTQTLPVRCQSPCYNKT